MIRFYSHQDIDEQKWNACIRHSIFPTLFAEFELLTLANPQWGALVKGDYEAVLPLPCRSKCAISYIYTPFFISRLGIFAPYKLSGEEVNAFFKAIPSRFKYGDLGMNTSQHLPHFSKVKSIPMVSYKLPLNQSYDTIRSHYSENAKRNILRAEKYGLKVVTIGDVHSVIELFRANRGSDSQVGFAFADYQLFEKMVDFWLRKDQVEIYAVFDGDKKMIAGACFLKDYQRRWFLFSGRDDLERDKRAMFFLLNHYIKTNAESDLILDFNGSNNSNVARFYSGFGSTQYEVPYISYSVSRLWRLLSSLYRRLR